MSDQLSLTGDDRTLTDRGMLHERQQAGYDYVRAHAPVTADEVGANQHARRGKHAADERCRYCAMEGKSILRSKALRPLVMRRKDGTWVPRDPKDAAATSPQLVGLPGESFEDIFR